MRKLAIAATVALLPTFAQAQECTDLADIQSQWQEQNISTELAFAGVSDTGANVFIFENPDNGRFSHWFSQANNPTCVSLFDQGANSKSDNATFTTAKKVSHEPNL